MTSAFISSRARTMLCLAGFLAALPGVASASRIFDDGFEDCCRVGGTVAGLAGNGLVLRLQIGSIDEARAISGNGRYRFDAIIPPGTPFSLSIKTQPNGSICSLAISGGTMVAPGVDNADVGCSSGAGLLWDSGLWGEPWN